MTAMRCRAAVLTGPAIIEEMSSTPLVLPEQTRADARNIVVRWAKTARRAKRREEYGHERGNQTQALHRIAMEVCSAILAVITEDRGNKT